MLSSTLHVRSFGNLVTDFLTCASSRPKSSNQFTQRPALEVASATDEVRLAICRFAVNNAPWQCQRPITSKLLQGATTTTAASKRGSNGNGNGNDAMFVGRRRMICTRVSVRGVDPNSPTWRCA
eukprot:CAMPEP_0183392252 /NCGR_PEP_ID=MMETSP0370-20130417/7005_1 /TAXON_ID=268820 /ORGANISM="Peridinium aciculiferum, Strain PAER-2" /LENGTH=123 /DNA_ID=CAMNT_0025572133 /DNA_START=574 /DNA_END=941 /DNA_ORIENTATION=-